MVLAISDAGPPANGPVTYTVSRRSRPVRARAPSGTVAFTDNGVTVIAGCRQTPLVPSGSDGTATCQTTAGTPGSHTIAAQLWR